MMDSILSKRVKNRKRKRLAKHKRRNLKKSEVKEAQHPKTMREKKNIHFESTIMTADAFWENYKSGLDWQQRHNVAWWRSRCIALEQENQILRTKIRQQAQQSHSIKQKCEDDEADEDFEFQVDNDMIDFLEQSVRHKLELRKKRDSEDCDSSRALESDQLHVSPAQNAEKKDNAKLLYGSAYTTIMAMETALEASLDSHKDHTQATLWPNIPLRP